MNTDEALRFIHRITASAGSKEQAEAMLRQLEEIVRRIPDRDKRARRALDTIIKARTSPQEVMDISKNADSLTVQDVEIAQTRKKEREAREREYARS